VHLRCDELQAIVQPLELRMNPELKVEIGDASRLQWDCIRSRFFGQLMLQNLFERKLIRDEMGLQFSLL
jgi:hypothetical protein